MSCCAPKEQVKGASAASCCAPKEPAKVSGAASCCAPKKEEVNISATKSSCCGPKKTDADKAATVAGSSCKGGATGTEAAAAAGGAHEGSTPLAAAADDLSNGAGGEVTHDDVKEYYGKLVQKRDELESCACIVPEDDGTIAEVRQLARNVHPEILSKFYGCGSPIPPLLEGKTVLDLGCGSGRDVFVAAQLVGPQGAVIGIDMTDEQLEVARKHEEWHREKFKFDKSNVSLRKGQIEDLRTAGVEDGSVDVVISNCVVNLAPEKPPVFAEVARVLRTGGELFFADIYADRRIPEHLRKNKMLFGECLGGALYFSDFKKMMAAAGLSAWGIVDIRRLEMDNPEIRRLCGDIQFFSATIRAVKLQGEVEEGLEDYGQVATYKGTVRGYEKEFPIDMIRKLTSNTPRRIDSTTAAMIQQSRYSEAFEVTPPGAHKGSFDEWAGKLPALLGPWYVGGKTAPSCC